MGRRSTTFSADAGLIARLGRELVGKQETALTELIKNSYDADATNVDVTISGEGRKAVLEIVDDGSGMTEVELTRGFLRLASSLKVSEPRSPKFKRHRAGRKGIGRFATERLGRSLKLTTRSASEKLGLRLTVDWDEFRPGLELQDIEVSVEREAGLPVGTSVRVERLRDTWKDDQLKRCLQNITSLLQPFPVAKVQGHPNVDPGFAVRFLRGTEKVEDSTIADLQTEILAHAHAVIEARVDSEGCAEWRITRNRFGEDRKWARIHHEKSSAKRPQAYAHLRNVSMRAYYFILQGDLLPGIVFSRVRGLLSDLGGIRLYRNGFRVVPYGDPDNDWLGLDSTYARRAETLAPVANRNFFGVVEVADPKGAQFEERTSREGLIENASVDELQSVLSSVLITAANTIASDRNRVGAASSRKSKREDGATTTVRKRVEDLIEVVSEPYSNKTKAELTQELREIREELKNVEADEAAYVQELEMLRFLASIGMATAEFSHEIKMTFQTFGLDMERLVEFASQQADTELHRLAKRVAGAREKIEAFTGYFNDTMASRNLRHRRPVSLKKAVIEFSDGIKPIIGAQGISIKTSTPHLDPLFTTPLHEAELSSVLLNLLSNAVKATKRASGERNLLIEAFRDQRHRPLIRFSDNGDGIREDLRARIFDPFVTIENASSSRSSTQQQAVGTGLGLWIVKQIVENFGGQIDVVKAPKGYVTAFEISIPDEDERRG